MRRIPLLAGIVAISYASVCAASGLATKVQVMDSLTSEQTYTWFTPGYASTDCMAQGSSYVNGNFGSARATGNCSTYMRPAVSGTASLTGYVLYLRLPDYRVIVASCNKKVNWGFSPGFYRDCRFPQCRYCDAEISGEKVRISWPVSLDGTRTKSESYKIESVLEPNR